MQLIARLIESSRLLACVRVKGEHFELWQYSSWVSGYWSSEALFQILRMSFSNRLTNSQSYHKKFGTALSSRIGRAIATSLNCYVSHGIATRFQRNGKKYYNHFIVNRLLFPTVKEFSKSVNRCWSHCKKFDTTIFETQCLYISIVLRFVMCCIFNRTEVSGSWNNLRSLKVIGNYAVWLTV